MPLEDWVRHSRHDMFLYDWQTLIAGVLALLAGFGTVWMTRHIANKQIAETRKQTETTVRLERERLAREADGVLASLAVEIREIINVVIRLHGILKTAIDKETLVEPSSLKLITRLPKPTVYQASADKIGLLGGALARKVASFFTAMDRISVSVDLITNLPPELPVEDALLSSLLVLFEQECRKSTPLLDALPRDEADADLKAEIEGLSKP
jgi:hypothetical protein